MVKLVRHRQTKEPATDRRHLNHRATSRLYRVLTTALTEEASPGKGLEIEDGKERLVRERECCFAVLVGL